MDPADGWIGVGFDGTLAEYGPGQVIGAPIIPMVTRVRQWIERGFEVRIVTDRVNSLSSATRRVPILERSTPQTTVRPRR